jgi:hypothetical protein
MHGPWPPAPSVNVVTGLIEPTSSDRLRDGSQIDSRTISTAWRET